MTRAAAAALLAAVLMASGGVPAAAPAGPTAVCDSARITLLTASGPVGFAVEIADDPAEQAEGLMFRPALPRDAGMLFVYPSPRPAAFWMKNTMIPLDMVFIDDAGQVVNVEAEAQPYTLTPRRSEAPVRAVLEINGGLAAEAGIGPGTQAIHPAFRRAPDAHRCPPPS